MRKILGKISIFMAVICFSACLTCVPSLSAEGNHYETEVWIPSSRFLGPDPDGIFLLVFDTTGSFHENINKELSEDFKNVYLILSDREKGVEQDAFLFGKSVKRLSEMKDPTDWSSSENTDFQDVFEKIKNYMKTSRLKGKKWARIVMVSDFYDSVMGEEYQRIKNDPEVSSLAMEVIKERTEAIDALAEDIKAIMPEGFEQDYILFPSIQEEKSGNQRYDIQKNAGKDHVLLLQKKENGNVEDPDGIIKRKFIELLMKGLTGDPDTEWKILGDVAKDDVETKRDYYLYSEKRLEAQGISLMYPELLCEFKTGGYFYYVSQKSVKDLGLIPTRENVYMMMVPEIKATILYSMTDNSTVLQEGGVEVKLELKKSGAKKGEDSMELLESWKEPINLLCSRSFEKNRDNWGAVNYVFDQNKRDTNTLEAGLYQIRLRKITTGSLLDLIVEDDLRIPERQ